MKSVLIVTALLTLLGQSTGTAAPARHPDAAEPRASLIVRAQVWQPTNVSSKNMVVGPTGPGSFRQGSTIACTYSRRRTRGASPKFWCTAPNGKEMKVKYAGGQGEVYGEVAATRLLWALGFGADWMYSVRVVCHGCPERVGMLDAATGDRIVDPAAVERKMPGTVLSNYASFKEVDQIDESAGGAPRAQRDAFKLIAVLLFHGDSKPRNQRIVCMREADAHCIVPLLMIEDAGSTFGSARTFSGPNRLGVNLERWEQEPIWKDPSRCVANLHGLFTSTLHDPVISEEGRKFLADLLMQLSDQQIHDLFAAARVNLRPQMPGERGSTPASLNQWVDAFKRKREAIVDHRCPAAPAGHRMATGPSNSEEP